jgi:hypothetical protein
MSRTAPASTEPFRLYGRKPDEARSHRTRKPGCFLDDAAAAFIGGARWIERYVAIGQIRSMPEIRPGRRRRPYIHQYAQNIQLALAEGRPAPAGLLDLV